MPSEVQQSKVTRQLPLHSNRHKAKAHSKGSVDFAIWLGPTNDVLGRMDEGTDSLLPMYALVFSMFCLSLFWAHSQKLHLLTAGQFGPAFEHSKHGGESSTCLATFDMD